MYHSPPAPPISVHAVTDATPELLDILVAMFLAIFPEDQRYASYVRDSARRARQPDARAIVHQWLVMCEGQFVGFRLFNFLRARNFAFDRYVGVLPEWRGCGIMRALQPLTLAQVCDDATKAGHPTPIGMCEELDHPDTAHDLTERKRREQRIAIYRRLGALLLDVAYVEPPAVRGMHIAAKDIVSVDAEPMLLALTPIQPNPTLDHTLVRQIVTGILVDNYRLEPQSLHVQQVLASVGRTSPAPNQAFTTIQDRT